MAALPLPACDAAALQRRLYDEYRVEVPVIEWNGRQLARVSVQGYNTAAEVETLVAGLKARLPQVVAARHQGHVKVGRGARLVGWIAFCQRAGGCE